MLAMGMLGESAPGGATWGQIVRADYYAAACIVAGMVCQLIARRLPRGLGTSLFVCLTTLGVSLAAMNHVWTPPTGEYLALRVLAALSMIWAAMGFIARKTESVDAPDPLSPCATFLAWSLVTGLAAAVIVFYRLVFNTWSRILDPENLGEGLLWSGSLWDLAGLVMAILFWRSIAPSSAQPVMLLSLAALGVWWASLALPAVGAETARDGSDWTFHLQYGWSALLLIAATWQDLAYRRRRRNAWPDRLDDLLLPYARWPAFLKIESIVAASILLLGVYQIVRQGTPGAWLGLGSASTCLIAGVTCLYTAYRRWSGNTAGLGIALIILAASMFACTVALWVAPMVDYRDYAERMAVFFNAILFALAVMIVWWDWLARFWRQQLLDDIPWTTAGRLIPLARQAVFLTGALAMLIAFQLALWPTYSWSRDAENTWPRFLCGLIAIAWLVVIHARRAIRDQRQTYAGMAVAFLIAAVLFYYVRMPVSPLRGWLRQYDQTTLAALALPVLVIAESLPATRGRVFAGPLWLLSLLILPAWSMMELLRPNLPADWVRPLTLAMLGALYAFAASRERRRAFLVLGGVLLLASLTTLYRSYWGGILG